MKIELDLEKGMAKRWKVYNGYAGIGGNRKLWEDVVVTAVENNEQIAKIYQDFFPNDKVIVGDAHQYLLDHYKEFDFIWSSPPCPTHSRINTDGQRDMRYPDMVLYQEIIALSNNWFKCKWCVENVISYYKPLVQPRIELDRHFFWANFHIEKMYFGKEGPISNQSPNGDRFNFNVSDRVGIDKRKALRNLVNPQLGLHILNSARNSFPQPNEGLFAL